MADTLTNRERFSRVLKFEPVDRLPVIEWASWWSKTIDRWHGEGLPLDLTDAGDIRDYFGLDPMRQYWIYPQSPTCPQPQGHGAGLVASHEEYRELKKHLYPEQPFNAELVKSWAQRQSEGELVVWISLDGPFWWPRVLFGIEPHMYAFYDYPELMNEMNEDLVEFSIRALDQFCEICTPDFVTFAEDMSYNHGPMLSKALFDEFMTPFYRRIAPVLQERSIVSFVDSDGDITKPVAWFEKVGIQGILPLERMAGVDVNSLRETHPRWRMIGAFDKTVMHLGEARMRQEFERLMPAMRQGGFIPSCDHQTPPEVSLEDYRLYVRLLREYCEAAAK
ncbi:MAG TPA: uroporphyrinogen decarboxylase family protein [Armatimonadota bacterium]